MYVYIYIYIYIEREREREREQIQQQQLPGRPAWFRSARRRRSAEPKRGFNKPTVFIIPLFPSIVMKQLWFSFKP